MLALQLVNQSNTEGLDRAIARVHRDCVLFFLVTELLPSFCFSFLFFFFWGGAWPVDSAAAQVLRLRQSGASELRRRDAAVAALVRPQPRKIAGRRRDAAGADADADARRRRRRRPLPSARRPLRGCPAACEFFY